MNESSCVQMTISILNLIVLTLTLGTVVWYTIITRRMQQAAVEQVRELVHQTRLNIMPAVTANIVSQGGDDFLELSNVGNGIAINIEVDPVEIRYPTLPPGVVKFDTTLMLPRGEKCRLASKTFQPATAEKGIPSRLTSSIGRHAHYNAKVNIHFQDIEGSKYTQTLLMGKDGYEHGFVRPDKV